MEYLSLAETSSVPRCPIFITDAQLSNAFGRGGR